MEFLTPGFILVQPWLLQPFGECTRGQKTYLSLSFCLSTQ